MTRKSKSQTTERLRSESATGRNRSSSGKRKSGSNQRSRTDQGRDGPAREERYYEGPERSYRGEGSQDQQPFRPESRYDQDRSGDSWERSGREARGGPHYFSQPQERGDPRPYAGRDPQPQDWNQRGERSSGRQDDRSPSSREHQGRGRSQSGSGRGQGDEGRYREPRNGRAGSGDSRQQREPHDSYREREFAPEGRESRERHTWNEREDRRNDTYVQNRNEDDYRQQSARHDGQNQRSRDDGLRDQRDFDYSRDEWDRSGNPDSSGNPDYRDDFAPRGGQRRPENQGNWNENDDDDYRSEQPGRFDERYDRDYPEREYSGRGHRGEAGTERGQRRETSSRREHATQRSR